MIAVAVVQADNPEIRDEDYAAAMIGDREPRPHCGRDWVGHAPRKTGGVMGDAAARTAAGVLDGERIVAIVNVGEPAQLAPPKRREPGAAFTTGVPDAIGRSAEMRRLTERDV